MFATVQDKLDMWLSHIYIHRIIRWGRLIQWMFLLSCHCYLPGWSSLHLRLLGGLEVWRGRAQGGSPPHRRGAECERSHGVPRARASTDALRTRRDGGRDADAAQQDMMTQRPCVCVVCVLCVCVRVVCCVLCVCVRVCVLWSHWHFTRHRVGCHTQYLCVSTNLCYDI